MKVNAISDKLSLAYLDPRSDFSFIQLLELFFIMEFVHQTIHEVHARLHHVSI